MIKSLQIKKANIKFHNVVFHYSDDQEDVLRSINLNIEGGKMTSLGWS